jgi:predicted nucleotidyltransferase
MGLLYDRKQFVAPQPASAPDPTEQMKQSIVNPYAPGDPRGNRFSPTFQSADGQPPQYSDEEKKMIEERRNSVDKQANIKKLQQIVDQNKGVNDSVAQLADEHLFNLTGERSLKSDDGDFVAGFKTGAISLKQLGAGAVALTGDATGNEGMQKWGVEKYRQAEQQMKPYNTDRTTSLEDIHGVGNAIDWAQYQLGNLAPSMLESVGSALIGAAVGSAAEPGGGTVVGGVAGFVAKKTVKKFIENQIEKQMAKGVAEEVAKTLAQKELKKVIGAGTVMFANSYIQGMGDVYGETMDENGKGNVMAGFLGAIPYAALDTVADLSVLDRVIKGSEGEKALIRYSKAMISSGIKEGAQESAQEADLMIAGLASGKTYTSQEVISRLGNSFAAAGLGGGVAGSIGGHESESQKMKDKLDITQAPNSNVAPETGITEGGSPTSVPKMTSELAMENFQQITSAAPKSIMEPLTLGMKEAFTPAMLQGLNEQEKNALLTVMDATTHYPGVNETIVEQNMKILEENGATSAFRETKKTLAAEAENVKSQQEEVLHPTPLLQEKDSTIEPNMVQDVTSQASNVTQSVLKTEGKTAEQVSAEIQGMDPATLEKTISQIQEKTRREMGLMVTTEDKGVTRRVVTDATGGVNFVSSDFSLAKAKAQSRDQAIEFKKYTHELLYENDPIYAEMIDKHDENKLQEGLASQDRSEVDDVISQMFDEGKKLNRKTINYEQASQEQEKAGKAEAKHSETRSAQSNTATSTKEKTTSGKDSKTISSGAVATDARTTSSKSEGAVGDSSTSAAKTSKSDEANSFQLQSVEKEKPKTEQKALNLGVDKHILFKEATGIAQTSEEFQAAQAKSLAEKQSGQQELSAEKKIQGMEDLSLSEIKSYVGSYIDELEGNYELEGLDFEVIDMEVVGSRTAGLAKKKSDLDVFVEYKGDAREDDMFNALNRKPLKINGIKVDINPIKAEDSGTLAENLKTPEEFYKDRLLGTMDNIKHSDLQKVFTAEYTEKMARKIIETANPAIQERIILNIAREIAGDALGTFNKKTGEITISQENESGLEIKRTTVHELIHAAWQLLSNEQQKSVLGYVRKLSLEERRNILGRTENGTWRYDMYMMRYKGDGMKMAEEIITTMVADRHNNVEQISMFRGFVESFVRLVNKVTGFLKSEVSKYNSEFNARKLFDGVFDKNSHAFDGAWIIREDGLMANISKNADEKATEGEFLTKQTKGFERALALAKEVYEKQHPGELMPESVSEALSDRYVQAVLKAQGRENYLLGKTKERLKNTEYFKTKENKMREIFAKRAEAKIAIEKSKTKEAKLAAKGDAKIADAIATERGKMALANKEKTAAQKRDFQKTAIEYINGMLPTEERGKKSLIENVAKLKNESELNTLFQKVWDMRENYDKRKAKESAQEAKRIERETVKLDTLRTKLKEYKDKVGNWDTMRTEGANYAKMRLKNNPKAYKLLSRLKNVKTMNQFQELIETVDAEAETHQRKMLIKDIKKMSKYDSYLPVHIRQAVRELRTGYKDASLNDLLSMRAQLKTYKAAGQEYMENKKAIRDMKRSTMLEQTANHQNFDVIEHEKTLNPTNRKTISTWEKTKDIFQSIDFAYLTPGNLFDMLDGFQHETGPIHKFFYQKFVANYNEFRVAEDAVLNPIRAVINANHLELENMERIAIYAYRIQEGGTEKLLNQTGYTQEQIDAVHLTEGEMQVYSLMRSALDQIYPHIRDAAIQDKEMEVAFRPDYFPMPTQNDLYIQDMGDFFDTAHRKRAVSFNNTISRQEGAHQRLVMDAARVFDSYVSRGLYYAKMGQVVKDMSLVANDKAFQAKIGVKASDMILKYVDRLAKMGNVSGNSAIERGVNAARSNVIVYILGFAIPTVTKQFVAAVNGMTETGAVFGVQGQANAYNREWNDFMDHNSFVIKDRSGGDVIFEDLTNKGSSDNKSIRKIQEYHNKLKVAAMLGTKVVDRKVAGGVWIAAYMKAMHDMGQEVDLNSPNSDALWAADQAVRKTQGVEKFFDMPELLGGKNKSAGRLVSMFQTMVITGIWNYARHDIVGEASKETKIRTAQKAAYLGTSIALEAILTVALKDLLTRATGGQPPEDETGNYLVSILSNLIQTIPGVGQLVNMTQYGSVPIPLVDMAQKMATSANAIMNASNPATKMKHLVREASYIMGTAAGTPLRYPTQVLENWQKNNQ